MKTILHPTDFSDNSLNALDFALEFARKSGALLLLVHAYDVPYDSGTRLIENERMIRERAAESMEWLLKSIKENSENDAVTFETVVTGGSTLKGILNLSEEREADLIVMGTRGSSDLQNVIFGSTSSSIAVEAGCQVLAVPDRIEFSKINRLVYATDMREDDLPIIWQLIQIATYLESDLQLLYISSEDTLQEEMMFRGFRDLVQEKYQYETILFERIEGKDFNRAVQTYLENVDDVILAVGYYRNRFLDSLSNRDNVREMANHTRIPLLTLPHPEETDDLITG